MKEELLKKTAEIEDIYGQVGIPKEKVAARVIELIPKERTDLEWVLAELDEMNQRNAERAAFLNTQREIDEGSPLNLYAIAPSNPSFLGRLIELLRHLRG